MNVRWIMSVALSGGLVLLTTTVVLPRLGNEEPAQIEQQAMTPADPAEAEALRQEAIQLQSLDKSYLAIARLERATQLDPTSAELFMELANLHLQMKDYSAAIDALESAHGLIPEDLEVLRSLGVAYMHAGQAEAAAGVLEAVADLQPIDASVRFYLGNAYLLMGEDEAAEDAFESAIARFDRFWPAINNIGLLEYERGNVDRAMQLWQDSIAIDASAAEPKLALATALYHQGQIDQAESLAAEAIWLEPDYSKSEFQEYHLWGAQLIDDAAPVLQTESVQSVLNYMPENYTDQ